MWLGCTNAGDYPSPGRAGAVFDVLFLLGTTPNYNAPAITRELIDGSWRRSRRRLNRPCP